MTVKGFTECMIIFDQKHNKAFYCIYIKNKKNHLLGISFTQNWVREINCVFFNKVEKKNYHFQSSSLPKTSGDFIPSRFFDRLLRIIIRKKKKKSINLLSRTIIIRVAGLTGQWGAIVFTEKITWGLISTAQINKFRSSLIICMLNIETKFETFK